MQSDRIKKLLNQFKEKPIETKSSYILLFIGLVTFLWFAGNNFISHSEFWAISSAKLLGMTSHESLIVYARPFYYFVLSVPYAFKLGNVDHILFARLLFAVLAFLHFFLSWKLSLKLNKSRWSSFLFLIFILSFHVYTYNIFRIRSDLLCQVLTLAAFLRILKLQTQPKPRFKYDPYIILFSFLISLTTPKSLYAVLWLCAFYVFTKRKNTNRMNLLRDILFLFLGPAYILILIAVVSGFFFPDIDNIFAITLSYYLNSFSHYLSWESLTAVIRSAKINILHYVVIFTGIGLAIKSRSSLSESQKSLLFIFSLSFLTLVLHPERWDYFIASIAPYLALPALFTFNFLEKTKLKALFLLPLIWFPFHTTYYTSWLYENKEQLSAIQSLESLLRDNKPGRYFDGTGILPRENSILWFLGPGDPENNKNTLNSIKQIQPEFIFRTPKLRHSGPEMIIFLHKNYQEEVEGIWVKKDFFPQLKREHLKRPAIPFELLFIYDIHPPTRW